MRVYETLLLSYLSIPFVLADFNFSNFPECAQPICYELAPQSCDFGYETGGAAQPTESCLCTNTALISDLAGQIFQIYGCRVLTTSAQAFNDNCATIQTNAAVSVVDFISVGDGGNTSCGSKGLDPEAIVGIAFGVLALLVTIVIGVWQLAAGVLRLMREQYGPWPCIQRFFCSCRCYLPQRHPHSPGTIPLPPYSP